MACRTTHTETVNSPVSGLAHDGRSPKAQVARVRDPSACKNEELVRTSGPCEAEELETTTSAKRLKVMWQMMTQGLQGLSQGLDLVAAVYTCSVASAILVGDGLCSGLVGGACAVVMLGGCAALGLSPMNRIVDVVAPLYTAGAVIAFSTAATGGGSRSLPDEMPIVNERHSDGRPNFTGTWRMVSCASRIRAAPVAYVNCISIMTLGQTYHIGGPAVQTRVRNNVFEDSVFWEGDSLMLRKVNRKHGYEILVKRDITPRNELAIKQTVRHVDKKRSDVVMTQLFRKTVH